MEIYTLTGPSGTGKSYRAIDLAREYGIEGMIDDGLFIYKGSVIAGESAKKSQTKIGAIKTAIFNDEKKAQKVARAIKSKHPKSILVLGTSDEMADLIIERLKLNKYSKNNKVHRIYIEDISTEEERKEAARQRQVMGKHVIPAPALQIKRSFAGYFLDTLGLGKGKSQTSSEKTVVRPSYSYIGEFILSENVIKDICSIVAEDSSSVSEVVLVSQDPSPENYVINIALKIRAGKDMWTGLEKYQKRVDEVVEEMTAFNVSEVNIEVRGIDAEKRVKN